MTPEEVEALRRKHYNATVTELELPNSDLMIVRVEPDYKLPAHKPGQYSTLGMGYREPRAPECQDEKVPASKKDKLIRRAYSISCSILDKEGKLLDRTGVNWLEFYIVLVRHSGTDDAPALTPRIFTLAKGSRLFLGEKIAGHFTSAAVKPGDNVLFLSTGTGEAPHNCLLWELLKRGHTGKMLGVCCVRYQRDLGYLAIHEELARRHSNYKYVPMTTRETPGGKTYIQDLLLSGELEKTLDDTLDPARTQVYLCGNPKMIGVPVKDRATGERAYPKPQGVIEILEGRGFKLDDPGTKSVGNIHFEEYW